jgi:outer membrane lipoprotein
MMRCFIRLMFVLTLSILVSSCAGGISEQARSQVSYFGTFADLRRQPGRFSGETVILGGKVVEIRVTEDVTEMEILHLELTGSDRPKDNDQSQGRYLVRTGRFLDPALYPKGSLVTVVGRIQGSETGVIGAMPYTYPLVELTEIKKWAARDTQSPRFHFGVGIGTHF